MAQRDVRTRGLFVFAAALAVVLPMVLAAPALAGPVVIDDFSWPDAPSPYVISLLNSNPYTASFSGPGTSIIGTERDVTVTVAGSPGLVSAVGTVGAGSFLFNTATPGAQARLEYSGAGKLGLGGVDLEDGTNNEIRLDFAYLDAGGAASMPLGIVLASKSGSATFSGNVTPSATGFSFIAPFADFVNAGLSFDSVDNIFIVFNGTSHDNVDFQLNGITATVPEPSTLALVGLGGALVVGGALRRRRRN